MKVQVKPECIVSMGIDRPPASQMIYIFAVKMVNLFETADMLYGS